MKTIEELGISTAPWRVSLIDNDFVEDAHGWNVCQVKWISKDAHIIAAAPKMYDELWKVCFGEMPFINCRKCKGAELGNCKSCPLCGARSALVEASGEV